MDQDSRGEGGSPIIADAVRAKISRAILFVGDLTIVAMRERAGGLINGNVAVEWGWAGASLGNDALIGVMNTTYGGPEPLPIDIHPYLVPVRYALDEESGDEEAKKIRTTLTNRLEAAVVEGARKRFFRSLHQDAPAVVEFLVGVTDDLRRNTEYTAPELSAAVGVSEESALAVMEDLNRVGLATDQDAGSLGSGFTIRLLMSLFVHFDPLYKPWNTDHDARRLAQELSSSKWSNVEPLCKELGWSPRRMNPAIWRIVQGGFATPSKAVPGDAAFIRLQLHSNENTRAFAEGRASLPPVAPRATSRID